MDKLEGLQNVIFLNILLFFYFLIFYLKLFVGLSSCFEVKQKHFEGYNFSSLLFFFHTLTFMVQKANSL